MAAVWLVIVGLLFLFGKKVAAREVAMFIPNLARLFKDLLKDPRVPRRSKFWLWFGIGWFAWPIDLIPEFIPVIGPADDAVVAILVLRHLVKSAGRDVVLEHWQGEPGTIEKLLRFAGLPATDVPEVL